MTPVCGSVTSKGKEKDIRVPSRQGLYQKDVLVGVVLEVLNMTYRETASEETLTEIV
jgi:hypothetical protein